MYSELIQGDEVSLDDVENLPEPQAVASEIV